MRPLWIIGAGGHAKVVIDTARATGLFEVVGVLDDDPNRHGMTLLGVRVFGDVSAAMISRYQVAEAVIAVGENRVRAGIAARLTGAVRWATVVHPVAHLAVGTSVGSGTVIFAGAIVQPDTTIGVHAVLNTACSVDHDGTIGDFVHIAPGARLAGNVQLEEGVLAGLGSAILPNRRIGAWTTVGAGAVVVHDLPPGGTAIGVPARFRSR